MEALLTINDPRKAVGKSYNAKDGSTLQMDKVENLGKGAVRIDVTMESAPEGGMAANPFGNNIMVFNGNFNGNINGVQFINGVPAHQSPTTVPKLVDAKGKKYVPEMTNSRIESNNGLIVRHATLTYRPEGQANQWCSKASAPFCSRCRSV